MTLALLSEERFRETLVAARQEFGYGYLLTLTSGFGTPVTFYPPSHSRSDNFLFFA